MYSHSCSCIFARLFVKSKKVYIIGDLFRRKLEALYNSVPYSVSEMESLLLNVGRDLDAKCCSGEGYCAGSAGAIVKTPHVVCQATRKMTAPLQSSFPELNAKLDGR